eukprot:TRINITY_DN1270_c0_g1_i1.p1 TRINITY_DN1270_c0_g1~~TRINITY_DN1270_c0_g1_i1.p1  ORF type:complete len:343 (+),score=138.90 TRINITY_DN1270_c0_g1_i1:61-1089(+)
MRYSKNFIIFNLLINLLFLIQIINCIESVQRDLVVTLHNNIRQSVGYENALGEPLTSEESGRIPVPQPALEFLTYSEALESKASEVVNNCQLNSNEDSEYGYNYFYKFGNVDYLIGSNEFIVDAVETWATQMDYYTYDKKGGKCSKDKECSAFLQMVWVDSYIIGCQTSTCSRLKSGSGNLVAENALFLVCSYFNQPQENEPPFEIQPSQPLTASVSNSISMSPTTSLEIGSVFLNVTTKNNHDGRIKYTLRYYANGDGVEVSFYTIYMREQNKKTNKWNDWITLKERTPKTKFFVELEPLKRQFRVGAKVKQLGDRMSDIITPEDPPKSNKDDKKNDKNKN